MESMVLNGIRTIDQKALVRIYEEHSPGLFRYAVRLLGDMELAEDCVSETFSRFLRAIKNGGGPREDVRAYLYRVAHNWITDHYRRRPPPTMSLDKELTDGMKGNPSQIVVEEIERELVRSALLRLTPEQRNVIVLRFLEGWSHQDVATTLGKSVEATRALQSRALASLRRMLLEDQE